MPNTSSYMNRYSMIISRALTARGMSIWTVSRKHLIVSRARCNRTHPENACHIIRVKPSPGKAYEDGIYGRTIVTKAVQVELGVKCKL